MGKIDREISVIGQMIDIYCCGNHSDYRKGEALCEECFSLLEYAELRLQKCPHGDEKPSCKECAIRCYNREYRVTIRGIMEYSGWRFMVRHPVKTLFKYIG